MDIEMRMTCEATPLQFEGTVDGNPAYFRSRFRHWSFCIVKPGGNPVLSLSADEVLYCREEAYGTGPYDAGYMPEAEGRLLMDRCVREWRRGRGGSAPLEE